MQFQWLVCGPSTRWYRAVCRFGPEALPQQRDRLAVNVVAAAQIGHACRQSQGAVILWPFQEIEPAQDRKHALAVLANLLHADVPALHLIEPPDPAVAVASASFPGLGGQPRTLASSQLQLDLLQLTGGGLLVRQPEDLHRFATLVRRFWNAIRPACEPIDSFYVPRAPF